MADCPHVVGAPTASDEEEADCHILRIIAFLNAEHDAEGEYAERKCNMLADLIHNILSSGLPFTK